MLSATPSAIRSASSELSPPAKPVTTITALQINKLATTTRRLDQRSAKPPASGEQTA